MNTTKAVMDSLQDCAAGVEPLAVLSRFRLDFHACLSVRGDELSDVSNWLRPGAATSPDRPFCDSPGECRNAGHWPGCAGPG